MATGDDCTTCCCRRCCWRSSGVISSSSSSTGSTDSEKYCVLLSLAFEFEEQQCDGKWDRKSKCELSHHHHHQKFQASLGREKGTLVRTDHFCLPACLAIIIRADFSLTDWIIAAAAATKQHQPFQSQKERTKHWTEIGNKSTADDCGGGGGGN